MAGKMLSLKALLANIVKKLYSHAATLSSHTSTLSSHTSTLSSHTSTLSSHSSSISSHSTSISNLNKKTTFSFATITVFSNKSVGHGVNIDGSKSAAQSGKTPIALCGWNLNNSSSGGQLCSWMSIHACYLSGGTIYYEMRNTHSSTAANVDFSVRVLYYTNP